jgi:hypothetical protein
MFLTNSACQEVLRAVELVVFEMFRNLNDLEIDTYLHLEALCFNEVNIRLTVRYRFF